MKMLADRQIWQKQAQISRFPYPYSPPSVLYDDITSSFDCFAVLPVYFVIDYTVVYNCTGFVFNTYLKTTLYSAMQVIDFAICADFSFYFLVHCSADKQRAPYMESGLCFE